MIKKDDHLKLSFLGPKTVVAGVWYSNAKVRAQHPTPSVILNNWIIGNDKKIERAKKWRHWFLDSKNQCIDPSSL
jgi:hypothetical protein